MTSTTLFSLSAFGLVLGLGLLSRFWPTRRAPGPLNDSGLAAIEMAIVFPILLSIVMIVVQCAHLLFATILVEHAAFCVSRSASVQIPSVVGAEARNVLLPEGQSLKLRMLSTEASALLAPTTRAVGGGEGWSREQLDIYRDKFLKGAFVPNPDELYARSNVVFDLLSRFASAVLQVKVEIRNQNETHGPTYARQWRRFGPSEILDVTVVYAYPLDVPAGGNILGPAIGYLPDLGNDWLSRLGARVLGVRYRVDIASTYRVINWGQEEHGPQGEVEP